MNSIRCAVLVGACLGPAVACNAQSAFRGLGDLPGLPGSAALAVSADASTVVGITGNQAFRWRLDTGMIALGLLPLTIESTAFAVSGDGSVVVGYNTDHDDGYEAFRWTPETGIVRLGLPPQNGTEGTGAYGISYDGNTVVGFANNVAVKWIGDAPQPVQVPGCRWAFGISSDGQCIVGANNISMAVRWTQAGGTVLLGDLPGGAMGGVGLAATDNGAVIVGWSGSANSGPSLQEAFRWTARAGMVGLGDLAGGLFHSEAYGVSGDGQIVVGYGTTAAPSGPKAFVWDHAHGMRNLRQVLTDECHLDLTGWVLEIAHGISSDGRTIVGGGRNPAGSPEAWMVYLDPPLIPPCPADFDHSGALDSQDFFDYLNAFFTSDPRADFNHSGQINTADFFDFLAAFFAGCG